MALHVYHFIMRYCMLTKHSEVCVQHLDELAAKCKMGIGPKA